MSNYSEEESCQDAAYMEDYSTVHALFKLTSAQVSPATTIRECDLRHVTERFDCDEKEIDTFFMFSLDQRDNPLWSLDQLLESNPSQQKSEKYEYPRKCPDCGKEFKNHRAFGGHKAKSHPKQSESYNLKKSIEKARVLKRKRGMKLGNIINKAIY